MCTLEIIIILTQWVRIPTNELTRSQPSWLQCTPTKSSYLGVGKEWNFSWTKFFITASEKQNNSVLLIFTLLIRLRFFYRFGFGSVPRIFEPLRTLFFYPQTKNRKISFLKKRVFWGYEVENRFFEKMSLCICLYYGFGLKQSIHNFP